MLEMLYNTKCSLNIKQDFEIRNAIFPFLHLQDTQYMEDKYDEGFSASIERPGTKEDPGNTDWLMMWEEMKS